MMKRYITLAAVSLASVSCDFLAQNEYTYQSTEYQFSTFENTKAVCPTCGEVQNGTTP